MAEQVFNATHSQYIAESDAHRWLFTPGSRLLINDDLTPATNPTRLLSTIRIYDDGRIQVGIAQDQAEHALNTPARDLSDLVEMSGSFEFEVDGNTLLEPLAGADQTEPYEYTPSDTTNVLDFYGAVTSATDKSLIFTLRDFVPSEVPDVPDPPPPTTSAELRASAFASETADVWLLLLTITHAALAEPIRIVNNNENIDSNGETFTAFGFDISLPVDSPERAPQARITIDNVSRELIETLRSLTSSPTVRFDFIRAAAPDVLELTWTNFQLQDVVWDAQQITATLSQADLVTEPFPAHTFTPAFFRGLAA